MNVVTPLPIAYGYPQNSVGTEAARRDNVQREVIPVVVSGDKSATDKGVASDQERASQSLFNNPTYEKPSAAQTNNESFVQTPSQENASTSSFDTDKESAGKSDAEDEQQRQEQDKVAELKARDLEVRMHEQAHAAVGGQYAGSPTYEYEQGPDGNRYAVGGEVSIDVSEANDAQQTVQKMQQVQAAALAPAEPSAQDYKVAAEAAQKEQAARSDLAKEKAESRDTDNQGNDSMTAEQPTLGSSGGTQKLAQEVVSGFYASVSSAKTSGLSFTA